MNWKFWSEIVIDFRFICLFLTGSLNSEIKIHVPFLRWASYLIPVTPVIRKNKIWLNPAEQRILYIECNSFEKQDNKTNQINFLINWTLYHFLITNSIILTAEQLTNYLVFGHIVSSINERKKKNSKIHNI